MNPTTPDKPQIAFPWRTILLYFMLIAFLSAFLGVITGLFIKGQMNSKSVQACTDEAKICPDGSAVGRTGPNCEFSPCPTISNSQPTQQPTSIQNQTNYTCPPTEYVDCMPIVPPERESLCKPEYLKWAQANCPNFQGAAY